MVCWLVDAVDGLRRWLAAAQWVGGGWRAACRRAKCASSCQLVHAADVAACAATAASAGAKHQCSPIGTVHVNVSAASSIWHSVAVADGWSCQSSGRRGGGDIGDSVASVPVQRGSRVQPSALHVNVVDAAAAGVNESEWCGSARRMLIRRVELHRHGGADGLVVATVWSSRVARAPRARRRRRWARRRSSPPMTTMWGAKSRGCGSRAVPAAVPPPLRPRWWSWACARRPATRPCCQRT